MIKGSKQSEEAKMKISESHKGFKMSDEQKLKISLATKGIKKQPLSEETKKKISETKKQNMTDEIRKRISLAHKGIKQSDEAKIKIGNASRGNKYRLGQKASEETKRKMIITRTKKYNISLEWANQFNNIDKLSFLNHSAIQKRYCKDWTTEIYIQFIEMYYYDMKFNFLYNNWINNQDDNNYKPSLDHKTPISKGGLNDLNNLQFITWGENLIKRNIDFTEWNKIKFTLNHPMEKYFLDYWINF